MGKEEWPRGVLLAPRFCMMDGLGITINSSGKLGVGTLKFAPAHALKLQGPNGLKPVSKSIHNLVSS
jgi:hypothetical protein